MTTKLAAAVGTTFAALLMGTIARAQDLPGAGTANEYTATENSISAEQSPQRTHGSSPAQMTEQATVTYSDGRISTDGKGKKKNRFKSGKRRTEDPQLDHSHDD